MIDATRGPLARAWHGVMASAVKFGVVGIVGLVVDVLLFNLLRFGVFGEGGWAQSAIGAKTISTSVAIVCNWLGNRYWTFRADRRRNYLREFGEFLVVSLGGMGIGLLCLWVSHYVLGFTSILADNIASNVVGLALGTLFRFALYRGWVYGRHRRGRLTPVETSGEPAEPAAAEPVFEEPEAKTA